MLMRGNFYTWLTWQLNNTVFTRDWVANFSHIIRIALSDLSDSKVISSNNVLQQRVIKLNHLCYLGDKLGEKISIL